MNPPGWNPIPEQPGRYRWWNGVSWEDDAQNDERIDLARPTVFGTRLEFRPERTWPPAPTGWFPPPLWEPGRGWDDPTEALWRVADPDTSDSTLDSELDSLMERARVADAFLRELDHDSWHIDFNSIPLVWTAPPSWPPAPRGWSPPAGWKAPRVWGRAPDGWEFWQHDREVVSHRVTTLWNEINERSAVLMGSLTGIAKVLDTADRTLCRATTLVQLAVSPLPTAAQAGFHTSPPGDVVFDTQTAHYELSLAVSNLRTYLLRLAFDIEPGDVWSGELRQSYFDAREKFILTASDAAKAVFDAAVSAVAAEVKRLERSRPRDRQERVAWLSAVLDLLRADMTHRARVLNHTDEPDGQRTSPDSGST